MKRTRAQNPKHQDPQDLSAANPTPNPKPQRKAKQPRQPKAASAAGGKKASAAREAAAAAAAAAASAASAASALAEVAPLVPDVAGGGVEVAGGLPPDWDEMDGGLGSNGSPWWTFGGVDEEKLLGWFPFVEEDFGGCHGGAGGRGADHEAAGFDDDIWRIHQIYEIPSYAAK